MSKVKSKVKVTMRQAQVLELLRRGWSEPEIIRQIGISTCAFHGYRVALRAKGLIGRGRRGVRGVPVLVAREGYEVVTRTDPLAHIVYGGRTYHGGLRRGNATGNSIIEGRLCYGLPAVDDGTGTEEQMRARQAHLDAMAAHVAAMATSQAAYQLWLANRHEAATTIMN